jgi:hypothetical protein
MPVIATQHIRRMRGGAQSHLLRCSDGHYYVVKFRNNPQHVRILANELLGSRLAQWLGLPVPMAEIVEVEKSLLCHSPDLNILIPGQTILCEPGLHFGSRYAIDPMSGRVLDWIPKQTFIDMVRNLHDFAGALVFDKWTYNADGRQAAFCRAGKQRKFTAYFIDQGYCFNAGEWTFPDYPLRSVFALNEAYSWITGWESFEPWLSRVENLREDIIWSIAGQIPPEWYGSDWRAMEDLGLALIQRRNHVRDLISWFRVSVRRPFPMWVKEPEDYLSLPSMTVRAEAAGSAKLPKLARSNVSTAIVHVPESGITEHALAAQLQCCHKDHAIPPRSFHVAR